MKIKVEKDGPCRKSLIVEQPAETAETEYRKVLENFVRFASIPGFRKGRAPANLVASRFAREIREETGDRLVAGSYREAIKQAQLDPLSILDVKTEMEPGKPMVYRLVLDVPPEFKLPKYQHIAVSAREVSVSEDDVQKAFDRFLERLAAVENVSDRPVRKGDWVQIDYARRDNGAQPKSSGARRSDKFAAGRNFWMVAGEDDTLLPGFAAAVEGMPIGGRREISLQLPPDFNRPELAGKQVVYDVTLKAARERKKPVMNDDFFKSAGVQSEPELRDKIKASLLEEALRLDKERREKEIIDYLLERTAMELPESIVQEEIRHMFASIARDRLMRGTTREQLASQKEEILALASKTSVEKVKLGYILHRIGEQEKIAAEDAEVEQEIQNMARDYRMTPDELKKELEKKDEMDALRHGIRMKKILDFLLANSVVGEKGLMTRLFGGGRQKEEAGVAKTVN
ncbi:MAG: trigger factor [Kiritimatiellae bacterium]|nr:trigger factor [Kiritimatiellia bacterium]